jgi:SPP1 gp7 family putative phage head morphogenesis protein
MNNQTLFSSRTKILRLDRGRKSIQEFISAWQAAENTISPRRQKLIDLYEMVLLDNHLSGIIENRKHKVLGETFLLVDKNGNQSDKVNLLRKSWFDKFVEYTLDAIYFGYSLIELKNFDETGYVTEVALVERRNIIPEKRQVLINSYDNKGEPIDNPAYQDYYIFINNGLGLLLKASPMVIYKRFSMGSHASFNERFGLPNLIVKTDRDDAEKRLIEEQMLKVGTDGIGVISKDDEVDYLQPATGADSSKTFENLIERVNSELSKLILGHTKNADDEAKSGQQTYINKDAINKTPSEERVESDMTYVQNIVNEYLIPRLIRLGYPLEGLRFVYNYLLNQKISENQKTITPEMLKVVLEHYDLPEEYFEKNFGLQVIKKQKQENIPVNALKDYQNLHSVHHELRDLYGIVNGFDDDLQKLFRKFQAVYERITTKIYSGTRILFDKTIASITAKQLIKTLQIGEDVEKDKALRYNIFYFSGAKTYQQLKEINSKLLDGKGKLKSFEQFYKEVKQTNQLYNRNYLQAEYEHAIAAAQMISIWKNNVEKDKNILLKYSAVGDRRTTPLCKKLDGTILPASDRFWAIYYPPNHWRCRSTVIPIEEGKVSSLPSNIEKPEGIFSGNVATQGIIFPENHPYYNSIPEQMKKKIKEFAEDAQKSDK